MKFPDQIEFANWINGHPRHLVCSEKIKCNSTHVTQITDICNEPMVYETLFRDNLKGEPYSSEKAIEFFNWANEGWVHGRYFVFFIMNELDEITGCMDIKSAQVDCAEIGYWSSYNARGNITNALIELSRVAAGVGFKRLVAYVRTGNLNSARVLDRAKFQVDSTLEQRADHISWSMQLAPNAKKGARSHH